MSNYFYAHIVKPEDVHAELDILDITDEERNHLQMIIESSMHHVVLDALLTQLSDNDVKKTFLMHITDENHEGIWSLLHTHLPEAEKIIIDSANNLKQELLADIEEARMQE